MGVPRSTRLRHISAKNISEVESFLASLPFRVQIYSVNYVKNRWFVLIVPPDDIKIDLQSVDL